MHMNKVIGLLVLLCCELCVTIKVPTIWNESANSAVNNVPYRQAKINEPQSVQTLQQSQAIPVEYFQYTAKKPQFATDIAVFHGVKNPQQHYKAYPIKPHTGKQKPILGVHQLLNEDKNIYEPFQKYVKKAKDSNKHVHPMSTGYEIFHPYKAEEPALQAIYKDPILAKIRNDLHDSKNRLQAYEEDAGRPNITDDEHLESIEKTEAKLSPQKNVPAPYEIHRPERHPVYYRQPPRDSKRDHVLNQRFKHPWNQQNIKIRPVHYKPLKNHIQNLKQQHAMKYDDEQNEYPQINVNENIAEPDNGYDIYEKGKEKYTQLRNNVDESINKAVQENRPTVYQKLELQSSEPKPNEEDDEFIPVKNYAQVRKTETIKHVPKNAAFDDAETYEEIINAPRLREAIKSSKAQVVYSEEGYEDSAYDHAGEQKHASDHEGHGGFLKQNVNSVGLYKIPTVLESNQDGSGSEYKDKIEHGKKWQNDEKDTEEETKNEDYSENEYDETINADIYNNKNPKASNRNKREDEEKKVNTYVRTNNDESAQETFEAEREIDKKQKTHEVDKRETSFEIPTINLNTTFLSEDEILKIAKQKVIPKKDNMRDKYPYYFKKLKSIHKNSPLRYAENLKFIPKKSEGGTEFYDSRSTLECPEVEDDIDPIPEKLKNGNNPTETDDNEEDSESNSETEEENNTTLKQPRLNGLGDKIDCFKAKYFGENPLDSPFFKEEIISNPEPITVPKLNIYEQLKKKKMLQNSEINNVRDLSQSPDEVPKSDIFVLLDKLRLNHTYFPETTYNLQNTSDTNSPQVTLTTNNTEHVYTDILKNIKHDLQRPFSHLKIPASLLFSNKDASNKTYNYFQKKEEVTQSPLKIRRKRATPFVYEPYKIIRDSQYQDSKKTTTTSNISPLIRQLQTSRVVDRVSRSNRDDNKANSNGRTYVDIGKNERSVSNSSPTIVDISVDQRRGEPRYEIRATNHKAEYTPVENKRAMSIEDYKIRTTTEKVDDTTVKTAQTSSTPTRGRQRFRLTTSTIRPVYDVTSYLPKLTNAEKVSASNTVRKTVTTTAPVTVSQETEQIKAKSSENSEESDEIDDNDEDDDDDEEEVEEEDEEDYEKDIITTSTTTTTTTPKPAFRRRIKTSTTTENTNTHSDDDQPERLKLVTRFRNYKPSEKSEDIVHSSEPSAVNKYNVEKDSNIPKYREKKKKSSESTLVTDTKKYGDEDDDDEDTEEEEIDALIGVKHNMDDYIPSYEQEEQNKERRRNQYLRDHEEDDEDHDDDSDDDDDEDDSDDFNDDEEKDNEEKEDMSSKLKVTTPEPTKRTLVRTTEAPPPTIASHIENTENKPIITRKKIEIHKELPVNKSSPHVTQFKQDIKEVEIIKEVPAPKRKQQKEDSFQKNNREKPLELYKDDNLAKDINKLEDVEVFSEHIDIDEGPKHGGNYRRASKEDLKLLSLKDRDSGEAKDVEASQSENRKRVELDTYNPQILHGGNLKSINDIKRMRNSGRNAKFIELTSTPATAMHGGNLKTNYNRRRGGRRSERLVELDEDRNDDDSSHDDDYKSTPHNSRHDRLHGGNYRSAKLVAEKVNNDETPKKNPAREARRSATALLNNFVQAVPVLTTTPGYILDPSKRMYYYVDD